MVDRLAMDPETQVSEPPALAMSGTHIRFRVGMHKPLAKAMRSMAASPNRSITGWIKLHGTELERRDVRIAAKVIFWR
jgi:hypothetical protein